MTEFEKEFFEKEQEPLFYVLIEDIIKICIENEIFEYANKFTNLLLISGKKRADDGHTRRLFGGKRICLSW